MSDLILASQSPRRAELLRQAGFQFSVVPSSVDESLIRIDDPVEHVTVLSRMKAEDVASRIDQGLIIGADTIVYADGKILGKPESETGARKMLLGLSDNTHQVYSGFTLLDTGGRCITSFEKTDVTFRKLEDWEIDMYVTTGCPMDKAGAYGIQQQAGLFVEKIEGCYFNVVGFPLSAFYVCLKQVWNRKQIELVMRSRDIAI